MIKACRVLLAMIGIGSVVVATTVGVVDPLVDIVIVLCVVALIVVYLRSAAKLTYFYAGLTVISTTFLSTLIYQNISTTLYKFSPIILGITILIMASDTFKVRRYRSGASAKFP